jgi:PAS domain S-box-containing protein
MSKPEQAPRSASATSVFRILDATGRGYVNRAQIKVFAGFEQFFDQLDSTHAGRLDGARFGKAWRLYVAAPELDQHRRLQNELILRQKEIAILKKRLRQADSARREHLLRRKAEADRSRLEGLLESVSDVVVNVSRDGRITYLNRLAKQRVKRTKDEFVGRKLTAIFPGEVGQMVQDSLALASRDKTPKRFEYFSKVHLCWFETRIFPTAEGAVIVSADISRRKQVECRLRETLERFRTASEMAMLGFWEWQPADDTVYFSPEWKGQLGYADAELPNRIAEWKSRLHPDDRELVLQQVARSIKQRAADFEIEYRLAHKDGGYRWISARWMVISDDGTARQSLL